VTVHPGWPPSAPCSRCPPSAPRGHVTPDRTYRMRAESDAARTGGSGGMSRWGGGVPVRAPQRRCVPRRRPTGSSLAPIERACSAPASAVRGSRRSAVGLSLAGLSLVRPVPVVRSSLAESRQRRPARCGSHARSPYVTYVTAGTGPAIRSCAIGDESAVRERCEFSHRPAGPLCSSSAQMRLPCRSRGWLGWGPRAWMGAEQRDRTGCG
jgi:hypothetical protein